MKKLMAFIKVALLLIITSLIITNTQLIILSLLFIALSILGFTMTRTHFFSRLKILLSISVFIMLFQMFFNRAFLLPERLVFGYQAAIRISCASMFVFIMMEILSPTEILSLLDFLPKKIQFIIGMTFSLIPIIINEEGYISLVQKSRPQKKHFLSGFTEIIVIIIPLMHRVLRRAETVALTIVSRGYM